MKLEEDPFIRKVIQNKIKLEPPQKVALIRRANKLMNNSNVEEAKKIFLAVGNSDGLSKVGDYYYKKNLFIDAAKMYLLSKDKRKIENISKEFSNILKTWIK